MAFTTTELQLINDGSAGTPSMHFLSSLTTGLFIPIAGELSLTASGISTFTVKTGSAGAVLEVGTLQIPVGSAAVPTYTFSTDTNTGIYNPLADQLGITANGVQVMHFDDEGVSLAAGYMDAPVGSAGAPSYTFTGDVQTGMYAPLTGDLSFTSGGVRKLLLDSTGATLGIGAIIDTDGGSLTLQANGGVGVLLTGDPVANLGAVTKQYVDAFSTGLDIKASVRGATTGTLVATRSGNIITETGAGTVFTVDGITWVLNDRVLVKDDITIGNQTSNGIYTVTVLGVDGVTPFELTRATDADVDAEVTAGMFCFVTEGTDNADIGFVLTTNDPIILNTTALAFTQFTTQGGDIVGPGASTQDAFMRWNNTTGTSAKDTIKVTMDDEGEITFNEPLNALRGIVYPNTLTDAFHFKDSAVTHMVFNSNNDRVLFPTGVISMSNATTATNSIKIVGNLADSLSIEIDSGTKFLKFDTTTSAEVLTVGAATNFSAGIVYASTTISVSDSLDSSHYLVRADTSGGSITLTLPTIALNNGRQYKIFKSSAAFNLSIDPFGSENIDGNSATLVLTSQYDHISLICNSTDGWFTF